jgi:hypothetical protein
MYFYDVSGGGGGTYKQMQVRSLLGLKVIERWLQTGRWSDVKQHAVTDMQMGNALLGSCSCLVTRIKEKVVIWRQFVHFFKKHDKVQILRVDIKEENYIREYFNNGLNSENGFYRSNKKILYSLQSYKTQD